MDLFGKNVEKTESIEKNSEEIILEHIHKIAEDDIFKLLNLFIKIMDKYPNLNLLSSFRGLSGFRRNFTGGFYQIKSITNYPFYSGDVLIFSHEGSYKKGDTLQYCDFTEDGEISLYYLMFDYHKEDGIVVRTFSKEDEKKYTIQPWQILGRLVYKYDFASSEWEKFLKSEGVDKDRIIDDIERDIELITANENFIEKDTVLSELNKRKESLGNNGI